MSRITDDDLADLGLDPLPPPPELTPGRALLRRSRGYVTKPRKLSPERMIRALRALQEMPVTADACMRAGVSVTGLKYWLQKSSEGTEGDGFDLVLDPNEPDETIRFHDAWENSMSIGLGRVERAAVTRALGYLEPLTYQGRVIYKLNPDLQSLGYEGTDAYLLDENGSPVPESIMKQDPDLQMFILKTRLSDTYGNKQTLDVNVRGGVLAVGMIAQTSEALIENARNFRQDAVDAEFEDMSGDEDPE